VDEKSMALNVGNALQMGLEEAFNSNKSET
jgi:hypothetical protein